jgi:drug/metabolite transporter (DMT)-like permease
MLLPSYSTQTWCLLLAMLGSGALRSVLVKLYYQHGLEDPLFVTLLVLAGHAVALPLYYLQRYWNVSDSFSPKQSSEESDDFYPNIRRGMLAPLPEEDDDDTLGHKHQQAAGQSHQENDPSPERTQFSASQFSDTRSASFWSAFLSKKSGASTTMESSGTKTSVTTMPRSNVAAVVQAARQNYAAWPSETDSQWLSVTSERAGDDDDDVGEEMDSQDEHPTTITRTHHRQPTPRESRPKSRTFRHANSIHNNNSNPTTVNNKKNNTNNSVLQAGRRRQTLERLRSESPQHNTRGGPHTRFAFLEAVDRMTPAQVVTSRSSVQVELQHVRQAKVLHQKEVELWHKEAALLGAPAAPVEPPWYDRPVRRHSADSATTGASQRGGTDDLSSMDSSALRTFESHEGSQAQTHISTDSTFWDNPYTMREPSLRYLNSLPLQKALQSRPNPLLAKVLPRAPFPTTPLSEASTTTTVPFGSTDRAALRSPESRAVDDASETSSQLFTLRDDKERLERRHVELAAREGRVLELLQQIDERQDYLAASVHDSYDRDELPTDRSGGVTLPSMGSGSRTRLTREARHAVQWVRELPYFARPLIPALLSLVHTIFRLAVLLYLDASVAEFLMAGFALVASVLVARIVRRRVISPQQWYGLATVVAGLVQICVVDAFSHHEVAGLGGDDDEDDDAPSSNFTRGLLCVLGTLVFAVLQDVAEEIFLHEYKFPPLQLLGLEGVYAFCLAIPVYYGIGPKFGLKPEDSFVQAGESGRLTALTGSLLIICCVAGIVQILSIGVTSSMTRNVWKNFRGLAVLLIGICIYYGSGSEDKVESDAFGEPFLIPATWLNLGAFAVILAGLVVYHTPPTVPLEEEETESS